MGCFRELGAFTIPNKNGAGQVLRGSVQRRFIVHGCAANDKTLFVERTVNSEPQMRVYLDNCSFNRPFDDQTQPRIRLETEAKLCIQSSVQAGALELAWSYVLDFENTANPFDERRIAIERWKGQATLDVGETDEVLQTAKQLANLGLKSCRLYVSRHVSSFFPKAVQAIAKSVMRRMPTQMA